MFADSLWIFLQKIFWETSMTTGVSKQTALWVPKPSSSPVYFFTLTSTRKVQTKSRSNGQEIKKKPEMFQLCAKSVQTKKLCLWLCRLRPARERCEKSPRREKKTTRLRQKRKSASRIYAFSRRKKKRENFLTHSWETTQRLLLLAKVN